MNLILLNLLVCKFGACRQHQGNSGQKHVHACKKVSTSLSRDDTGGIYVYLGFAEHDAFQREINAQAW